MNAAVQLSPEEMPPIEIGLIDADNIDFFARYFPPEMRGPVLRGEVSALGAVVSETACAAIVYRLDGVLVTVESLYVAPDYRRQYIASTLFYEMVIFFASHPDFGVQAVDATFMDGGDGLRGFFQSLNFVLEDGQEQTAAIAVGDLLSAPLMSLKEAAGYTVLPFSKLSPPHLRELDAVLAKYGANMTGLPLTDSAFLSDLSFVCYKNKEPVSCVCFTESGADELILSVFFTAAPSSLPVAATLRAAANAVIAARPGYNVCVPLLQESASKLTRHMLGDRLTVRDKLVYGIFVI